MLGEFTRQLLTVIPTHIEASGWQAFDKADVFLFACAIVALFAALVDRMDITVFAGAAAGALTVVQMLDRPGPGEFVSLRWGPWLALAGALVICGASRMSSERPVEIAVAGAGLDEADRRDGAGQPTRRTRSRRSSNLRQLRPALRSVKPAPTSRAERVAHSAISRPRRRAR